MNKAELSACKATETSLSRAGADDAVTAVFSTIDDVLASGETVTIAGFGTFSVRSRAARQGRNPRARTSASPSTPRRRLPSRPARLSARSSTSGFGEREYRCRTVPMRRGMNGRGENPGSVSAPPVRCQAPENPIRRPVRSRCNQIAKAFVTNVPERRRAGLVDSVECANIRATTRRHRMLSAPQLPNWAETLNFATAASLATMLAELLVAELEASGRDESALRRLFRMLVIPMHLCRLRNGSLSNTHICARSIGKSAEGLSRRALHDQTSSQPHARGRINGFRPRGGPNPRGLDAARCLGHLRLSLPDNEQRSALEDTQIHLMKRSVTTILITCYPQSIHGSGGKSTSAGRQDARTTLLKRGMRASDRSISRFRRLASKRKLCFVRDQDTQHLQESQ